MLIAPFTIPMQKPKRIVNKELLEQVRNLPCTACAKPPPSDPAHVKSKGAGGQDTKDNVMPLCRRCHGLQHSMGWKRFSLKNETVSWWLKSHKWEFNSYSKLVKT